MCFAPSIPSPPPPTPVPPPPPEPGADVKNRQLTAVKAAVSKPTTIDSLRRDLVPLMIPQGIQSQAGAGVNPLSLK